ncbi:MAG TPA: 50S ribosome-binding GTPase [Lentisphaeria bacterium]|nr:50S ribosome-binding GTPase [Lentisphaeria bacterium]
MSLMRFGALLATPDGRLAFYLSHRVFLTVLKGQGIRAISPADFSPCQVFARNAIAVSLFEAMMARTHSSQTLRSSIDLIRPELRLPKEATIKDVEQAMQHYYGATLTDFTIATPDSETKTETQHPRRTNMEHSEAKANMENYDVKAAFNESYKEARARFGKRPNILVCGYTGSGKSSLIRAILGDIVPQDAIGVGKPKTTGYDHYQNDLISIYDSKGLELGETEAAFTEETHRFIRQRQNDPNVDNHIHLVWYTIQGSGARVTECDRNLISNIFTPKNVIVVITKNDITRESQRRALIQEIMNMGVPAERIVFTTDEEGGSQGCKELMELSYAMLPEAYQDAFMEAQRVDKEAKIRAVYAKDGKAKAIIATATAGAAATGAIPIPLSDAAILVPLQVTMIGSLAALYGLKEEAIKQSALPFVARLGGIFLASSLLKFIPILGSAVNATVAGAITGAMGMYVKKNFEESAIAKIKGQPAPDLGFDVEMFKRFYEEYKKNKANA